MSRADFRIRADVEVGPDGSAQVFLRPLEGCYSRAPTLQAAMEKAPAKVKEYLGWLSEHGEEIPSSWWEAKLEACEIVQGDWPVDLGDSVALFDCDRDPIGEAEIKPNLRWMEYCWSDLVETFRSVPDGAWEWKPRGQGRTPRRIAQHVALVMVWYISKLRERGKDPPFRWPPGVSMWRAARAVERGDLSVDRLQELREACVHRLSHLRPLEMEGRVAYHTPGGWTKRTAPEGWTARKIFRRFLWHERLHLRTLRRILRSYEEGGAV